MVAPEPLATADDLTAFLAGAPDAAMRQVSGAVRRYCGWHIAPSKTETVKVDGRGSRLLKLKSLYVTAVSAVGNEGAALDVDADLDWSQDGYLELRTGGWWSSRPRQVEVTFTHGYAETPDELVGLVSQIAARAKTSPRGTTREHAGGVDLTFSLVAPGVSGGIALLQHEIDVLALYKLERP